MPSASLYLLFGVDLLKLVAVAPEFTRCDVLPDLRLFAGEKSRLSNDFDFDDKVFGPAPCGARVDKREEFSNIVPVRHDVDRSKINRGLGEEQSAKQRFEWTFGMASNILRHVEVSRILVKTSWTVGWGPFGWTTRDGNGGRWYVDPIVG
ncbi:hypothetical protein HG530_003932 [Fusarium avenaceum]|nr:hypothetical protein HG530_003932 [Fusarium avenaceum]